MILNGDALNMVKTLPDESIHCCVTSPPYYGLRDYGVDGQIGLEETPEEFINRLVEVFQEVKRVLRQDGTLWLNIGDSYAGSGKGAAKYPDNAKKYKQGTSKGLLGAAKTAAPQNTGCKPNDLIGIPWMLAFALRADGWYLRQDIIWSKPNPMPESVKNRCTKAHEYIFLLSKSRKYYFDSEAIAEPVAETTVKRLSQDIEHQSGSARVPGKMNGNMKAVAPKYTNKNNETIYSDRDCRNKRDVWNVSTQPYKEAHFATFPKELIRPCIVAGSPAGGIILDPFFGSGTTGEVALEENRDFIGIDLNKDYCGIAKKRVSNVQVKMSVI